MPISHTNRKSQTYFLCQDATRTGKPRYFFSKTAAENTLEQIPAGHHIEESVNGVVSLVKDRQQPILPEEIQIVETALRHHSKGNNYRVAAKGRRITIYERIGPDAEDLLDIFNNALLMYSRKDTLDGIRASLDKNAQYTRMLHFDLVDVANRTFCAERVTYVVSLPEWVGIGGRQPLQVLVDKIIPLLDTDEYFVLR